MSTDTLPNYRPLLSSPGGGQQWTPACLVGTTSVRDARRTRDETNIKLRSARGIFFYCIDDKPKLNFVFCGTDCDDSQDVRGERSCSGFWLLTHPRQAKSSSAVDRAIKRIHVRHREGALGASAFWMPDAIGVASPTAAHVLPAFVRTVTRTSRRIFVCSCNV